jgi:TatD DNase family protein
VKGKVKNNGIRCREDLCYCHSQENECTIERNHITGELVAMRQRPVLSDNHCHLERYLTNNSLSEVLAEAKTAGVGLVITMGMTIESSGEAIAISQNNEMVKAAVGIHPWNAVSPTEEIRRALRELAQHENVVAIGEVGLDYIKNPGTEEVQKELLKLQLSVARESGLPASIHCREAYDDMLGILRAEVKMGLTGWIHGFSGGKQELQEWLDLGLYISPGFRSLVLSGLSPLQEAVCDIPPDRLLTETDCARTQDIAGPGDVLLMAQKIASLVDRDVVEIGNTATANLKRLTGIS